MFARRGLVLLIVVVVVGRTLHCCYVNALLCASGIRTSSEQSPPLRNPDDLDPNETGCICKGAVLESPSPLASLGPAGGEPNALACLPLRSAGLGVVQTSEPAERYRLGPPPLGGRALRAWVGCLLI